MAKRTTHFAIRRFRPEFDCAAIGALYSQSIIEQGATSYEPDVIEVWRQWGESTQAIALTLSQGQTLIAQHSGRIAGFAQRQPHDHINMLYTHPDFARRGIASALLEELLISARRDGVRELSADASRVSRPLFEKHGFKAGEAEWIERENLRIERFPMTYLLDDD
ncbi:GNAT family N-acetyltransferase [Marinobacter sp. R17]|uniref:GNAT family N-acetyltransferase n=1 Tax=Marinobacter sp. R17 TaxID=2484250 RepID=UPI00168158C1|nr:GNAT family N-acetyltransferase [Marinobacter sp. R17]